MPSQIELPTCYVGKRTTKEVKKHHVKKKTSVKPAGKHKPQRGLEHPRMLNVGKHEQFEWPRKFVKCSLKALKAQEMTKVPFRQINLHEEFAGYGTAACSLKALIGQYNLLAKSKNHAAVTCAKHGEWSKPCRAVLRKACYALSSGRRFAMLCLLLLLMLLLFMVKQHDKSVMTDILQTWHLFVFRTKRARQENANAHFVSIRKSKK